jgi:hypothetical protein
MERNVTFVGIFQIANPYCLSRYTNIQKIVYSDKQLRIRDERNYYLKRFSFLHELKSMATKLSSLMDGESMENLKIKWRCWACADDKKANIEIEKTLTITY